MSAIKPFSISRVFNAPRELVFQAFTEPVHLVRWFGPAGCKVIRLSMDLRAGGIYHYGLQTPDGGEMWGKQVFLEVTPPERLVIIQSFSDKDGGLTRHPMSATWPLEMHATSIFEDAGDGTTKLTINWAPHNSDEASIATFDGARENMAGGFTGMFGSLDTFLQETEADIIHSRLLKAPAALVWKALTDPKHVNAWWGPKGFKNTDVQQDVRVGGNWRFKMQGPDGGLYQNKATYLELVEPSRLVMDLGDDDSVHFRVTITLNEEGDKTRITMGGKFPDRASRDAVLKFGALDGGQQSLAKLEALLATI